MKFILVLFFSSFLVHDYHVSNTLINYNKPDSSLEITMKIFHDDLDHIRKVNEESQMNENYQFDTEQYIRDNFIILVNNDSIQLKSIGREIENELLFCYFEVLNVDTIISLEVENTILFDLFDDQTNMIDFELTKNSNERILLTHEQPSVKVFPKEE